MPSKKHNQRHHAKVRAIERYGLVLNRHEYQALVAQIQSGAAVCLGRSSCRVTHWIVTHGETRLYALYDRLRKAIITFLPPEALESPPANLQPRKERPPREHVEPNWVSEIFLRENDGR